MSSIGTTRVGDVMVTKILTVKETDTMEQVAKTFKQHDINAAPVIDSVGKCVGIVTSHDVVEYESSRAEFMKEFCNSNIAVQIFKTEQGFRAPGSRYNEAGFHMSTSLKTACPDDPLSKVARKMCHSHVHHILVFDDEEKLTGFVSSLDILGFVIGEPVCRTASCETNSYPNM